MKKLYVFKLVSKLFVKKRFFPYNQGKKAEKAHREVNQLEKRVYGTKRFKILYRIGQTLNRNEILGHVNKEGQIYISKKVPQKYRKQVQFHERQEHIILTTPKTNKSKYQYVYKK